MKAARKSIGGHKAKEFEGNAEAVKASVNTEKPGKPVRNRCEAKTDGWMENIKEFIRNIDVKSL